MQEDVFLSYDRKGSGEGDDTIIRSQDRHLLSGGDYNDSRYGRGHDDYLDGGDGRDILSGGDGDDRLEGGAGNDILRGDDGHHNYVFQGAFGVDVLRGFGEGDTLKFQGITYEDLHFDGSKSVTISSGEEGAVRLLGVNADDLDHGGLTLLDA